MNTLMLAVIALVAFIYCGGSRVPPVLRQNKDMILGVVGGLVLASFAGLRLEGATMPILSQAKKDGLKEREKVLERRERQAAMATKAKKKAPM
jgi:hypothetical protein